MNPAEFLRSCPPFDRLPPERLTDLESDLQIAYQPRGTRILTRGGPPNRVLYVIRKGTVQLERDGDVVQVLEEGDCFGFPSLIGRSSPHADVIAVEDVLLYQVPGDLFDRLFAQREFADFFVAGLADRLRRSAHSTPTPPGRELATSIGRLPVSPPVSVPPSATVAEAARVMRARGISSVLVEGHPRGILTDRDLRSRVLAEGRSPDTAAGDVATRPVRTVRTEATLFEVLVFMLEQRVHHAPVESNGLIVGVVTDTDLLRLYARSPLHLLQHVERMTGHADLVRYATELEAMVETMRWSGLGAAQVGPVVSRLNDALVGRLARLAEAELGPPPAEYAWLVHGSEGRMEQALLTDQDNAIVYAADVPGATAYFKTLAERVVAGLIAASFPPCPGGFMATTWRLPLAGWLRLVRGWVNSPEPAALVEALNFFDFRAVHGTLDPSPLDEAMHAAAREPLFLAQFARASLGLRPPLGAFRQLKAEAGGVDVKKGGIAPIVGLARLYALEAGSTARSTLERLDVAAAAGTLSRSAADSLSEGFRFLFELRLREQLRARAAGEPPGSLVRLEALSPLERQHVKAVFVAIAEVQRATAIRHDVQRLA
jgi:CBS domain-containing protein